MASPGRPEGPSGPLTRTLARLLDALRTHGARAAIAGGIAQQVWGRVRATRDLDVLVSAEGDEASLLDALAVSGFRESGPAKMLAGMQLRSLVREDASSYLDVAVDLFVVRGGFAREAVDRAVTISLGPLEAPVVTAEDLLLLKLLADRILDRKDAEDIVREQGERLELAYVRDRARRLGVSAELERALKQGG